MKRKPVSGANETWLCLLWGLIAGLATVAVGIAVCAWILTVRDCSESAAVPMGTVCIALGAGVSGYVAARRKREQGMVAGGLTGLALFLLMLIVSVFVSGTRFTIATPVRLLLCVSLSALGGILGVNLSAKRRIP